jgi:predicted nucleic-acid-binding protein
MIGLDTNVLLRAVTQDHPQQSPVARALIEKLEEANPGYVNVVVLVEFGWSLRTRYKYERGAIIDTIEAMLASAAFVVSDRDAVNAALSLSRDEGLHFADALIGELNRVAGCSTTMTFDHVASKRGAFTEVKH